MTRSAHPVRGRPRPWAVRHHVVAGDRDVGEIVLREGAHTARRDRRAGESPRLVLQHQLRSGDGAVVLGAELNLDDAARRRAGAAEHLLAAHHDLDRTARLLRQRQRHRLQIDHGLAAEPAADLGRHDADRRHVHAKKLGAISADHELALARRPDLRLAVGVDRDDAGMRLDIGLMHRLGRVTPFNDDIGEAHTGLAVAFLEADLLGDVRRPLRLRLHSLRKHVVVQDRRIFGHRLFAIDHVWQHLVLDLDQVERLGGDDRRNGGERGDRVTLIQYLVARHDVARQVAEIHRAFADKCLFRGISGKSAEVTTACTPGSASAFSTSIFTMRACGYGLRLTLPYSIPAIFMSAPKLARPVDLVDAIGPDRTRADDFQLKLLGGRCHGWSCFLVIFVWI